MADSSVQSPWLLRCHTCNKVIDVSLKEASGYLKNGWPTCCKEVMTLCTQASLPVERPEASQRP